MRYYVVRNGVTSEFAIIEDYVYQQMIEIIDTNRLRFFHIYFAELEEYDTFDDVIEYETRQGYSHTVVNNHVDEIHDFVFSTQS